MVLCAIAFILSLNIANVQASTGTATSVSKAWAGVNINDDSGVVNLGSTVHIYWTGVSPSTGTVYVTVYKPDGTFLQSWGPLDPTKSGTPSFTTSMVGNYYIFLDGYPSYHMFSTIVASVSVFVVPESVFGTLAAVGAGVAAFGTFGLIKVKRKKR